MLVRRATRQLRKSGCVELCRTCANSGMWWLSCRTSLKWCRNERVAMLKRVSSDVERAGSDVKTSD